MFVVWWRCLCLADDVIRLLGPSAPYFRQLPWSWIGGPHLKGIGLFNKVSRLPPPLRSHCDWGFIDYPNCIIYMLTKWLPGDILDCQQTYWSGEAVIANLAFALLPLSSLTSFESRVSSCTVPPPLCRTHTHAHMHRASTQQLSSGLQPCMEVRGSHFAFRPRAANLAGSRCADHSMDFYPARTPAWPW